MMDMGISQPAGSQDFGSIPMQDADNSYRLVKKEYFCFICDKKYKKLIQVQDLLDNGLTCDECGQGFCEVIEQGNDMPLQDFVEKVGTL